MSTEYSQLIKKKLFTKEDGHYLHIHKILGSIVLISFIYRYSLLFTTGSFQLENRNGLYTLVAHGLLSGSSMIFRIPNLRNRLSPMIYPEFRIHSILFAYRSLFCCLAHYYNKHHFYPFFIIISTMIGADITTYFLKQDSTMRSMPFPNDISEEKQKTIHFFHSSLQVGATIYMFENMDTAFGPLCAIQMAAFLMTLVRKNIIKSIHWHMIYSGLLIMNFLSFFSSSIGNICMSFILFRSFLFFRFYNKMNKYVAWSIVYLIRVSSLPVIYYVDSVLPNYYWCLAMKCGMVAFSMITYGIIVYKGLSTTLNNTNK